MSYSNYQQSVVINGYELEGVQSVDASYGISEKPVRVAGIGFVDALIDKPLEGTFSINRKMVSQDPLLEKNVLGEYKFDEEEINGAILYDNKSKGFSFTQARVSRYSVTCSSGEIPDVQTDITVYGRLGKNALEVAESNNIIQSLGARGSLFGYISSWFFKSKINSENFVQSSIFYLTKDTAVDQGGWIDHTFFGLIKISLLKNLKQEVWFKMNDDASGDDDASGLWFYASNEIMGPIFSDINLGSFSYLDSRESSQVVPSGWIEWFGPGSMSASYKAIVYHHSNSQYYGVRENNSFDLIGNQSFSVAIIPSIIVPDRINQENFLNYVTQTNPEIQYPDQSSIRVNIGDFSSDAVSDFSYTRTINTTPLYALPRGNYQNWAQDELAVYQNLNPVQIDTQYPIEVDVNITIIVDEYQVREIKDRVQAAPKSDVEIQILDAQDKTKLINSFNVIDARLVSESINSSTEDEMSISLTYKGYESYRNRGL